MKRQVGDTDAVHWDVTLVQPLFKGFGILSKYKVARSESEIGSLKLEQTAKDLVRDVKTAYYEALLAQNIEKVAEEQVRTLEAQERDAQGFYDHGVIPKNDLLKSKIAKASAVQELEKARSDSQLALSRLSIAMGHSVNSDFSLVPVETEVSDPGDLPSLMDTALKNRPEMKIMEKNLDAYQASINLARSTCYPEISLVGRYEQNGNDTAARENDYSNDHNTSVSVQAKWTFFEWGKNRADIQEVRYEKQAFSEKIKAASDQIRLETKQEYLAVRVREKNIKTAEEALGQAQENFRITRSRYLQNVTTATEVLEAQTFLSRAESDYHKSIYGYLIARARLNRATGTLAE
jgi:outer membrane protein TolC